MKSYLFNIILTILSLSQLYISIALPATNEATEVSEIGINSIKNYGGYYPLPSKPYNQYPKPHRVNKLNPADYVGKKVVRKGQYPPTYGKYVLEANFPEPYRIIRPNDPVTLDYSPDRLNVIVDENDIITSLEYY